MKDVKIQNAIKLAKVKFPDFALNSLSAFNETQTEEVKMNLSYAIAFPEIDNKTFIIEFKVKLSNEVNNFNAIFKMVALFETKEQVDVDFRKSDLVQINAPAIAFPYLRSFITTVTTNAGFKPIILPSINLSVKD